eukprot:282645_1
MANDLYQLNQNDIFKVWLTISICSLMFAIFQIYGLIRFKSISHLVIVQKRYPQMVIIEAIAAIIHAIIVTPLWFNTLFQVTTFGLNESNGKYIYLIGWIVLSPLNHFIVNMEACRLWLICFNLHYLKACKNEMWKSQIDISFAQKNWFLHNKNRYGNPKYIISRVTIPYCILAAVVCTAGNIYFQNTHYDLAQMIDG